MTNEESFKDYIEEKIKKGIPLSELECAIHSADQDATEATIAFVFAFLIVPLVPLLIYLYIKWPF